MMDDILRIQNERFLEFVQRAVSQAISEGIEANSILINENMVRVPDFWMKLQTGTLIGLPKMICGLNVYWTKNDLPDGYSFAIFERPNDRLTQFESIGMEPDELRKAAEIYRTLKSLDI